MRKNLTFDTTFSHDGEVAFVECLKGFVPDGLPFVTPIESTHPALCTRPFAGFIAKVLRG